MNKSKIIPLLIVFLIALSTALLLAQDGPKKSKHKPPTFQELLTKMDTNKDGKLAKSEVKGPLLKHFDKIDADKDRFISEEEFKKAPKPKRGKPTKKII